ncbi:hypothetical protein M9H77_33926 [Catharanthus roseus]|uniref:Uncharacterized protein n=1 Tax=Catharanthus roseus TaxID=4058 RepID=A0ACB9ZM61_CATRO|nr:hypothetical protein M9H77_33926 [Catharanthus roseus]
MELNFMSVQVEDERRKLQGSNEGKEEEMAKNDETGASPRKNWHPTLAFLRVEQVLGRIGAIVGKKNECRTFEGLHGEGLLGGTGGSSSNNWRRCILVDLSSKTPSYVALDKVAEGPRAVGLAVDNLQPGKERDHHDSVSFILTILSGFFPFLGRLISGAVGGIHCCSRFPILTSFGRKNNLTPFFWFIPYSSIQSSPTNSDRSESYQFFRLVIIRARSYGSA